MTSPRQTVRSGGAEAWLAWAIPAAALLVALVSVSLWAGSGPALVLSGRGAPTTWKPQRSYRRRAGLSGSTLKLSAAWRWARADTMSALSNSEPMPRPRCVRTTPIDSSGISTSTKPYPRSCSGSRRSHAAPAGGPSSATTPGSPGRGHPET